VSRGDSSSHPAEAAATTRTATRATVLTFRTATA
jgi:hypothetical protein